MFRALFMCEGAGEKMPKEMLQMPRSWGRLSHHATANIYKETKLVSKSTEWSSYSGQWRFSFVYAGFFTLEIMLPLPLYQN